MDKTGIKSMVPHRGPCFSYAAGKTDQIGPGTMDLKDGERIYIDI